MARQFKPFVYLNRLAEVPAHKQKSRLSAGPFLAITRSELAIMIGHGRRIGLQTLTARILLLLARLLAAALLLAGCARPSKTDSAPMTLADFQARAAQFNNRITAPAFETTPEAVRQSLKQTITDANAALDRVAAVKPAAATYANTLGALDLISFNAGATANRLYLIKETSTNAAVREAALHGLPGIAVSHYRKRDLELDWERARLWMARVLGDLLAQPWTPGTFIIACRIAATSSPRGAASRSTSAASLRSRTELTRISTPIPPERIGSARYQPVTNMMTAAAIAPTEPSMSPTTCRNAPRVFKSCW